MDEIELLLQRPFDADSVEWRVQSAGVVNGSKPYVMAVPYITARAVQARLDEVFGLFGWENVLKPTPDGKGYLCGITVHGKDRSVTKYDGAEFTGIEAMKGAMSDAMKRTAVLLGIGRYLYKLDVSFANCQIFDSQRAVRDAGLEYYCHVPDKNNRSVKNHIGWLPPTLPDWALPFDDYSHFIDKIKQADSMESLREAFASAYNASKASLNEALENDAIKAKDTRKGEISAVIQKHTAAKYAEVEKWLTSACRTFVSLPVKQAIESYYSNTLKALEAECKDRNIISEQLKLILDAAYTARIESLQKQSKVTTCKMKS
jgi:hypothetical protein